jgi:hypothetical protein
VQTLSIIEEGCDRQELTLVVHPAIRRAVHPYEESFYIGVRCFLNGEGDGVFFLPLEGGGYVRLRFSRRRSAGGYDILRLDAMCPGDMVRIKRDSGM